MITMGPPLPTSQSGQSSSLHTVLSLLSFATDIPHDELNLRNTGSVWSGLFCTSFDDDDTDLFFDAQENLVGNSSTDLGIILRGGYVDEATETISQIGEVTLALVASSTVDW